MLIFKKIKNTEWTFKNDRPYVKLTLVLENIIDFLASLIIFSVNLFLL